MEWLSMPSSKATSAQNIKTRNCSGFNFGPSRMLSIWICLAIGIAERALFVGVTGSCGAILVVLMPGIRLQWKRERAAYGTYGIRLAAINVVSVEKETIELNVLRPHSP